MTNNIKRITEKIEKYLKTNTHIQSVGVRALEDDEIKEIGSELRPSYTWDMEHDCSTYFTTREQLEGTCAIYVDLDDLEQSLGNALNQVQSYHSTVGIVVIGGTSSQYGNDENEIVIENAEVVAVVQ